MLETDTLTLTSLRKSRGVAPQLTCIRGFGLVNESGCGCDYLFGLYANFSLRNISPSVRTVQLGYEIMCQ